MWRVRAFAFKRLIHIRESQVRLGQVRMFQIICNKDTDPHIRRVRAFAFKRLIHIRESQVRLGQVRMFQLTSDR